MQSFATPLTDQKNQTLSGPDLWITLHQLKTFEYTAILPDYGASLTGNPTGICF